MNRKRSRTGLVLRVVVSLALLGYLLFSINLGDLAETLRRGDPLLLTVTVLLGVPLGNLISTVKWRMLLVVKGISSLSFARLWALYFVGGFFSNFLPTDVGGDLVRSYEVGKVSGRHAESLSAIVMERLTGFLAMIALALVGLVLNPALAGMQFLGQTILLVLFAAVVLTVLLLSPLLQQWVGVRVRRFVPRRLGEKLKGFLTSVSEYRNERATMTAAMALSIVFQSIPIVYVYCLMRSIGADLDPTALILVVPAVSLVGILPITINGIGLREGAFVLLLAKAGIDRPEAFAIAVMYRVGIMLMSSIGGVLYAVMNVTDYRDIPKNR